MQGKSLAINRQPNGEAWSIFDANWKTDLVNGLPYGGGMFWDSFRPYGSDLELAPQYFETQIPEYIKQGNAYQPIPSTSWRSRSAATRPCSRPRWNATTACAKRARTPTTTRSPCS